MKREQLITTDPDVALGKPVIDGTRITVEHVLERLGAGETPEELLVAHPRLTREGVRAAMSYAATVLRNDDLHPTGDEAV
jgi:uncharacterized protein (DUF433 family)